MTEDEQRYLTTTQLARRLGCSTETIRRWRRAGRIKPALVLPSGFPRWAWPLEELRPED